MTTAKSNLLQRAKQSDPRAIAALINRSLQPKGITAKVAIKDRCLQVMLESAQELEQKALVAFLRKGIISLETSLIERVRIYGRPLGNDFPSWSQEFELAGQSVQTQAFTFGESKPKKQQLKTHLAQEVLEQFMNLKARTSIGISYNDLPPVLGMAKLAVQKFERSPDREVSPYLTELIKKIMFYYEVSLECLAKKVQRASVANAIFIGFGSFTGIAASEPLGKMIARDFPTVPKSFVTGLYEFDTVLSALWIKAGELTDELDEILNKPIDLDSLKIIALGETTETINNFPKAGNSTTIQTEAGSTKSGFTHAENADKKIPAGLLAIFLGTLGIHKFFLGYRTEGWIMLGVTLLTFGWGAFIIWIISVIEGIIYLKKSEQDFIKTYVTSRKGWF